MRCLLIRHAPTAWNESGRLQGRADQPLSPAGDALARTWRLPRPYDRAMVVASPLRRALMTARALTPGEVGIEPLLVEMDWARFEGARLAELRASDPDGMAANEARGLDFRPPGGESPREVRSRLRTFFSRHAGDPGPLVAVTHKGVIRAAISLATGWAMTTRPPVRLGPGEALALRVTGAGNVELDGPPVVLGPAE